MIYPIAIFELTTPFPVFIEYLRLYPLNHFEETNKKKKEIYFSLSIISQNWDTGRWWKSRPMKHANPFSVRSSADNIVGNLFFPKLSGLSTTGRAIFRFTKEIWSKQTHLPKIRKLKYRDLEWCKYTSVGLWIFLGKFLLFVILIILDKTLQHGICDDLCASHHMIFSLYA